MSNPRRLCCVPVFFGLLLCLLVPALWAQTAVNWDFEDGLMRGNPDPMVIQPVIVEEADGNHYMRITGHENNCQALPANLCPGQRSRTLVHFTSHYTQMPTISASTRAQSYSARIRYVTAGGSGVNYELFQDGPQTGGYATRDGQGPVFICWRDSTNRGFCRANYDNETRSNQADLGIIATNTWHTYTLHAVWSHDPSQARIELLFDGQRRLLVTGRDSNLGPTSDKIPAFKLGMYGDDPPTQLHIDDICAQPGLTSCTGGTVPPPPVPVARFATPTGTGTTCNEDIPCSWRTAVEGAVAGQTIILDDGTYTGYSCNGCVPSGVDAANPTIIQGPVGGAAIIEAPANGYALNLRTATNVTVRNLTLSAPNATTVSPVIAGVGTAAAGSTRDLLFEGLTIRAAGATGSASCVEFLQDTTRITLRNSTITTCGPPPNPGATQANPGVHGIALRGTSHLIDGNTISGNQGYGISFSAPAGGTTTNSNTIVRNNRLFTNGRGALTVANGTNIQIARNQLYGNHGGGLVASNCLRCQFYNNTIDSNSIGLGMTQGGAGFEATVTGVFKNNLVIDNTGTAIQDASAGAVVQSNNLTSGLDTDLWLDPNNGTLLSRDYHLAVGSAAIDAGTAAICATTDVQAATCMAVNTLTGFLGAAPDMGVYESTATPVAQQLEVGRWDLNNNTTDMSCQANTGVPTSITYDAVNFIEGTHSAIFNGAADRIVVPLVGLTQLTPITIALSVRPSSFPTVGYFLGHSTTPAFANRIQLHHNAAGDLQVGIGDNHVLNPAVASLSTGTWYRLVLILDQGHYTLWVDNGVRAEGSYTGFNQLFGSISLGNNGAGNQQAFFGNLDAVRLDQAAWTPDEVRDDCLRYCANPPPIEEPPVYVPLVIASAELGTVSSRLVAAPLTGLVNPNECLTPTNFAVTYDGLPVTLTGCSITPTGSTSRLDVGVALAPTSGSVVITLAYLPTAQSVTVVNNFVATGTVTGLAQTHFWCRAEPRTETDYWDNFVDSADSCRMSSPGRKHLRLSLVNTGAAAPNQDYSLYCSRSSPVIAATAVTDDCTAELGLCLANLPQDGGLADGTLTTNQLSMAGGISFQSGGVIRRQSISSVTAELGANAQLEYEFPLQIPFGVTTGTTFSCALRTSDGVALPTVLPATVTVGRSRFVRR